MNPASLSADGELTATIAAALEDAKTQDSVVAASQRIQDVQSLDRRERLGKVVRRRLDEIRKH